MALSREVKFSMLIDDALRDKRKQLTPWEIKFLDGLRYSYRKYSMLTVTQKTRVTPILKRLELIPPSPKLDLRTPD